MTPKADLSNVYPKGFQGAFKNETRKIRSRFHNTPITKFKPDQVGKSLILQMNPK